MNKKNIILIALFAVLMVPLSCKKDFLTQTNTFAATQDATFNTSADVVGVVNAVYDSYQNNDFLKKSIFYVANFLTHDWFNNGADVAWNNYTIPSTFYAIPTFWNGAFIGINRANQAIAVIATAKAKGIVTAALADRLTGEAYFLRGTFYYYLAGTFGGVPLEVSAVPAPLSPRATQDQVFQQVVADMQKAEGLLTSKAQLPAAELGRATKGAAYAYEGSAQMWLKNYTGALAAFNNPELTNNYHLLPNFWDLQEFNNQNNDESLFEVQFEIPPGGTQSWGGFGVGAELAWTDGFDMPNEIAGTEFTYGSPSLYYSYQAGDTRKLATIIGPGDPNLSPGIIKAWGGIKGYPTVVGYPAYPGYPTLGGGFGAYQMSVDAHKLDSTVPLDVADYNRYTDRAAPIGAGTTYPGAKNPGRIGPINTNGSLANPATGNPDSWPWYGDGQPRSGFCDEKHFRDPTLTGGSGPGNIFGGQNQVLMRYAEVLLSRAECKIRTGDVAGGLADIKLVRDRAFGGTAPAQFIDGLDPAGKPRAATTDPMWMVLSEYRHELSADYSLMYCWRRAGKDAATGQNYDTECVHNFNHVPGAGPDNNSNNSYWAFGPTSNPTNNPIFAGGKGLVYNDIPPGHDILPIPTAAIALNPNLKQNPGY
ncbi:MAG: RagB/SusD family nutrient uptake outer membrane protein [Bacteroidota bacterium]|nr:RagB/SusD family nutrient uptake outer membrane protein [Bacteroidota bacterium]